MGRSGWALLLVSALAAASGWQLWLRQARVGAADTSALVVAPTRSEPILIGEVGSLTGPDAEFGITTRNGIELAINEANARGGVKGGQLALRVYDDQSKPAGAARATRTLVDEDHVVLILGEAASSSSLAMAPIAQAAGVPMVTPSSTNPAVTEVGDFIFRACFSDAFQGLAMARFARTTLEIRRVAVLVERNSVYSEGLGREFSRHFTELGGEVVASSYGKGDEDFHPQLMAIRKMSPEAIYIPGYVAEVVRIAQQARQLGLGATLLGGDGWDSERLFETSGPWLEGAYLTDHASTEDPAAQDFVRTYQALYGSVPDARAALGYDAARVAVEAMRRAPALTGAALRDALAATRDFPGVTGGITIDAQRNAVKPAVVLRVEGGKFKLVQTIEP